MPWRAAAPTESPWMPEMCVTSANDRRSTIQTRERIGGLSFAER
jgi:hypothetical protein